MRSISIRLVVVVAALLVPHRTTAAPDQSDDRTIRARDEAFGRALADRNLDGAESLLTTDVRFIRPEAIFFTATASKSHLWSIFGVPRDESFSRRLRSVQISASRDLAVVLADHHVGGKDARSELHLTIWRRMVETEWLLAADAVVEDPRGVTPKLVLRPVAYAPGGFAVELTPSDLAQQIEPATFRPSGAGDLAFSLGDYAVPIEPDAKPGSQRFGKFMAAWENNNHRGWHLIATCFPEPLATSAD